MNQSLNDLMVAEDQQWLEEIKACTDVSVLLRKKKAAKKYGRAQIIEARINRINYLAS